MVNQKMKPGVVNVLISYVLKVNNNKFTKGYVDSVASQWRRLNIETVPEAMELAEKEHFSEGYLSRLITAGTGLGFRELLAFARVEESEKILLSGSKKISSIAAEVGFSTTAYYEKFFKKWFGDHPEKYRKKYSDRVKGNSPELVFELSKSDAKPIILDSIQNISFEADSNTEKALKHKEILEAYEKTTRSHDEILRFMLGKES